MANKTKKRLVPQPKPAAPLPKKNATTPVRLPQSSIMTITWIAVLVLLLYLCFYNQAAGKDEKTDKKAATPEKEAPTFDGLSWFAGLYQDKLEDYLKKDSRLGKKLLPYKLQLDYDLYTKLNFEDFLQGKNDYFIAEAGINTYLGRNYVGDSTVNELMRRARVVQYALKQKNIDLVLLFVPNKEFFMPEIIPDKYLKYKRTRNNYDAYIQKARELGVNYIDFNPYLQQLGKKYKYPIYPKHGTHWSYFTECFAVDITIKQIEKLRGVSMPHMLLGKIEYTDKARMRDNDAVNKSGLIDPPKGTWLAYPKVGYTAQPGARPVKVLGIGDSYYRAFSYLGAMKYAFANGEYWYYYNSIETDRKSGKEVWEYDLKSKLEENEVILVLYSGINLTHFGDGFFDDAYMLYSNPREYYARQQQVRALKQKKKEIHNDEDLLDEVTLLSRNRNISLDSAISIKAQEMLNE